tara:strand:- start:277 stop:747 length:471 start_codon:yes stop_codon:yes gene_type:complete
MRLTIIPLDNLVIKDGEGYNVDNLDYLDSNINAIQWYEDKGEVEYLDGTENLEITDITPYNQCLTDWNTAKTQYEEDIKEKTLTDSDFEKMFRHNRNLMLMESDWTQGNDSPLSDAKKEEWKVYRQALRDMPTNKTTTYQGLIDDLSHSDYPTKPS